jgi:antibiotic biosynthesis monooxygenase (ABM) superfamily enzyme
MKMMSTPSFFFFRTNSKKIKSNSSGLPPYSKRAFVAVMAVIPVAFGLNLPLNSFASFMPVWGVIMINSIVIASYMTFIMPRASKLLASWLNSTKVNGVNLELNQTEPQKRLYSN